MSEFSQKTNMFREIVEKIYTDETRKLKDNLEKPHNDLLKNETALKKWQETIINTSANKIFTQTAIEIQKILSNTSVLSVYNRIADKIKNPFVDFFKKEAEKGLKFVGDYAIIEKGIEKLAY